MPKSTLTVSLASSRHCIHSPILAFISSGLAAAITSLADAVELYKTIYFVMFNLQLIYLYDTFVQAKTLRQVATLQLGFFFGAFWSALYEALFGYRLVSLKVARNVRIRGECSRQLNHTIAYFRLKEDWGEASTEYDSLLASPRTIGLDQTRPFCVTVTLIF